MKILAVSDIESKLLWDFYDRKLTEGVSLIISCGDLKKEYLEFLVTMVNCPLLYVRGNHDERYHTSPPEGCECIEDTLVTIQGVRILGLGGSMRYRDGKDMYTEEQMSRRIKKARRQIKKAGGLDLFVAHAPAYGYGDLPDHAHRGFQCYNELLEENRPLLMLHGHVHQEYGHGFQREHHHPSGTKIMNVYGYQIIDLEIETAHVF